MQLRREAVSHSTCTLELFYIHLFRTSYGVNSLSGLIPLYPVTGFHEMSTRNINLHYFPKAKDMQGLHC